MILKYNVPKRIWKDNLGNLKKKKIHSDNLQNVVSQEKLSRTTICRFCKKIHNEVLKRIIKKITMEFVLQTWLLSFNAVN